jgi:transposase
MATQYVAAYRKGGNTDANDAEALCEAVGRPNMPFVAIKSDEQHRATPVGTTSPNSASSPRFWFT